MAGRTLIKFAFLEVDAAVPRLDGERSAEDKRGPRGAGSAGRQPDAAAMPRRAAAHA